MKVTCGTDIIEIDRIKKSFEDHSDIFARKIFTDLERDYCEKFRATKYEHYAARFAAKEATYKALSNYIELDWKDIEIENQDNGKPNINLNVSVPDLEQIDVTLSHCKSYATAYVVATFK